MQIGKGEKSILCELSGVHLYSSQELAYVIYHYPLLVMDQLVDDRLLDFLREELNLGFLALKLDNWRKKRRRSGRNADFSASGE